MEYNDDIRYIAEQLDKELNGISKIIAELSGNIPDVPLYNCEIKEMALEKFITENKDIILDRLFELYRPVFDEITKLGYKIERNGKYVCLINYSPAGEEINITLLLDGEDDIIFQLFKLYNNFDEEDHAYELLEAKKNGLDGVPSMRGLIDDAVAISDMYEQLYITTLKAKSMCK